VTDCLFCKIVAKELDSDVVAESTEALAFRDINPTAPTHVLVVSKEHIGSAGDLTSRHGDLLGKMFEMLSSIAADEGLDGGYRIVTNVGREAGQSVPHLHFHLIGGRGMSWPPG
jgi:histidine triad (HIT) family protein